MKEARVTKGTSEFLRLALTCMRSKLSVILDGYYQDRHNSRDMDPEHVQGLDTMLMDLENDLDDARRLLQPLLLEDEVQMLDAQRQ